MAGASDKARFYLEKSVPELREFERKGVFSKDEISSIVKKRSGFEHTLNARGSQVSDYVRYAEYEMNLEALRRKRIKRLGVRSKGYDGQRRIFSIMDRATQKFHGDVGLWILYIDFARKQKSYKKISEVMTKMLRMHPTKSKLWVYAATYALEEKGDIMEARNLLQRGLRFCEQNEELWIQYGKLEMLFIAKIVGRRRVLGLDQPSGGTVQTPDDQDDSTNDVLTLPTISAGEFAGHKELDMPAKSAIEFKEDQILFGAMPMAVFDAALKQFGKDSDFALNFFDMVAEFGGLPCREPLLNHVMTVLRSRKHKSSAIVLRYVKQPLAGIKTSEAAFPSALGLSLSRMRDIPSEDLAASAQADLYLQTLDWLLQYTVDESLDQDLRQVLIITLPKVWQQYRNCPPNHSPDHRTKLTSALKRLEDVGLNNLTESGWS